MWHICKCQLHSLFLQLSSQVAAQTSESSSKTLKKKDNMISQNVRYHSSDDTVSHSTVMRSSNIAIIMQPDWVYSDTSYSALLKWLKDEPNHWHPSGDEVYKMYGALYSCPLWCTMPLCVLRYILLALYSPCSWKPPSMLQEAQHAMLLNHYTLIQTAEI
jgi:hypothetical protein